MKVLATVAKPLGKRAAGTVEFTSVKRLRNIVFRYADEAWWVGGSLVSAFASLAGLGFAAAKSISLRFLRRLAR